MKYQTTYNPSITSSPFLQTASYLSWASIFREYFGGGGERKIKEPLEIYILKNPKQFKICILL